MKKAWRAFLDLHCRTNGGSTATLLTVMRVIKPPRRIAAAESLLGHFDEKRISEISAQIARDGYFVFDQKIPASICNESKAAALTLEANTERLSDGTVRKLLFDQSAKTAHRYSIPESDSGKSRPIKG